MKKTILITLLLFPLLACLSQNDTINNFNNKGQKHGYWIKKENGKVVYEGRFINDKPVGLFKYYYPSGKTKNISVFQKNGSVTYTTTYFENGQISSVGKYIDQQRDSVWTYFNDTGKKVSIESFKNGVPHGKWEKYDPKTEILLDEKTYVNGKKHGPWKTYYTTGQLRYELMYNNDLATGPYKCYYIDGNRWHTGFYKNSFFDSTWVSFSPSGQMIKREKYRNQKKVDAQIFAYTASGTMSFSVDSIAYFVSNKNGVDFYLIDGKQVTSNSEFSDIEDLLNDKRFILVSDILLVSRKCIAKATPEGKDAFVLELYPKFPYPVMVVGNYAETIRSLIDKSKPEEK